MFEILENYKKKSGEDPAQYSMMKITINIKG